MKNKSVPTSVYALLGPTPPATLGHIQEPTKPHVIIQAWLYIATAIELEAAVFRCKAPPSAGGSILVQVLDVELGALADGPICVRRCEKDVPAGPGQDGQFFGGWACRGPAGRLYFWAPGSVPTLLQCRETSRIFTGTELIFASGNRGDVIFIGLFQGCAKQVGFEANIGFDIGISRKYRYQIGIGCKIATEWISISISFRNNEWVDIVFDIDFEILYVWI